MHILLISGSLNPDSNSRVLMREAEKVLTRKGADTTFIDLRDYPLPMCDGDAAYDAAEVPMLSEMIRQADAILIGVPIYNYDVNAAVKNVVELTGSVWEGKVVGFLCAAGGRSSYMSVMGFANSLMFDFRCLIIPRFVYAVGDDFREDAAAGETRIHNLKINERIALLVEETLKIARVNQPG